jgi:hypothetical protein
MSWGPQGGLRPQTEDVDQVWNRIGPEFDLGGIQPGFYPFIKVEKKGPAVADTYQSRVLQLTQVVEDGIPLFGRGLIYFVEDQGHIFYVPLEPLNLEAGIGLFRSQYSQFGDDFLKDRIEGVPFPAVHINPVHPVGFLQLGQHVPEVDVFPVLGGP